MSSDTSLWGQSEPGRKLTRILPPLEKEEARCRAVQGVSPRRTHLVGSPAGPPAPPGSGAGGSAPDAPGGAVCKLSGVSRFAAVCPRLTLPRSPRSLSF